MSEELGSIIDFGEDLTDAEAPKPLPDNDYPAEITAAEQKMSNSGRPMAVVSFNVKPEDFPADYEEADSYPDGKTLRHYIMLESNTTSRFRMRKFLEAIGAPMKNPIDLNDWVGKSAVVSLTSEEYEGVENERIRKVVAA